MKKIFQFLLCIALAASLRAQTPVAAPDYVTEYSPDQLDQLVAPIALYPDALVALILPASTAPADISQAAQYFAANGDPAQIPAQSWDDSVKALANYPSVIQWMSDNLDWTTSLGRAFLQQPTQVMESIQQMRAIARANGTLVDTPQQNVTLDGSNILIEPASNDALYVPEYDPDAVFGDEPTDYNGPVIFFGTPYVVGPWLSYECDWDDFGIWRGTWHPGWAYTRDWRQSRGADQGRGFDQTQNGSGGFWRPDAVHQRDLLRTVNRPVAPPPRARPMAKAPVVPQRSGQAFHPAAANLPARADPTGWRADASGKLAVAPRTAPQSGPKIIGAPAITPTPNRPAPSVRAPDLSEIRPQNSTPTAVNRTEPQVSTPTPNRPAPEVSRPASPQVVSLNNIQPADTAPRAQIAPQRPATPGPAFGSYTRGTAAQDFSNRGQASRAAVSPPPVSAPRPMPVAPPSAPPPRSEPPPSATPGRDGIKH